ncbi:hypothetical protein I3271_07590 [Photobacterium leiognathi]|uniref:hypothetical protein n=1 Tax=Photobacterium leiognathi TaxID=553611 RepID=UPI001EDFFB58|nr:hypothetical protein [Photobacterium leiognathi]MCG3884549.1 hypothetical protein [Photobacterium leiognathi]
MSDIKFIVESSIEKRNVFHSERDFQLALGLCLMKKFGDNVRLEYPLTRANNKNEYCDIVCAGFNRVGIELKYKTASLSESINGEDYHLKHQGAQDCGRYDFLRDVLRLEQWVSSGKIDVGYAVLLTNNKSYWLPEKEGSTAADLAFRLSDGRVVLD